MRDTLPWIVVTNLSRCFFLSEFELKSLTLTLESVQVQWAQQKQLGIEEAEVLPQSPGNTCFCRNDR